MEIRTIGIDLGKTVFHLVGVNARGEVVVRKKCSRTQLLRLTSKLRACLIGMEACGGSHFLGRALREQGHDVRLMPAQYVKPYVKTNKNDYIDAEAIAEAVTRPTMRFVPIKTDDQLYARVSKKDGSQDAENQTRQLRQFAASQGWQIIHEYTDRASGKRGDRDQFQKMFAAASRREFDILLFWSLDRLSREGVVETLNHLERLTGYGVNYRSFTEQYLDSTGIFKEAVIGILAAVAKQERVRRSERTIAGLERARAEGRVGGRRPKDEDFKLVALVLCGAGVYLGVKHAVKSTPVVSGTSFQKDMDSYCTTTLNDSYLSKLSADGRKGLTAQSFFSRKLHTCIKVEVDQDPKDPKNTGAMDYMVTDLTYGFVAPPKWHPSESPLHITRTDFPPTITSTWKAIGHL